MFNYLIKWKFICAITIKSLFYERLLNVCAEAVDEWEFEVGCERRLEVWERSMAK